MNDNKNLEPVNLENGLEKERVSNLNNEGETNRFFINDNLNNNSNGLDNNN